MNLLECGRVGLVSCVLVAALACDESRVPPRMGPLPTGVTGFAGRSGSAGAGATKPGTADADAGTKPGRPRPTQKPPQQVDEDGGVQDDDAGVDEGRTAPVRPSARDGSWMGTTSQGGRQIEFDIKGGALTFFRLSWGVFGCDGDNATTLREPIALDDSFSASVPLAGETTVTFEGSFDDDDSASGTLEFETPGAGVLSCGVGRATWSATRAAR